jgi:FUN14 domain-containing protein 1
VLLYLNQYLFLLQADRFIDRKLDQAEGLLKNKGKAAKKWYTNLIGDDQGPKLNELHIFAMSFAAGVALGIGTA